MLSSQQNFRHLVMVSEYALFENGAAMAEVMSVLRSGALV